MQIRKDGLLENQPVTGLLGIKGKDGSAILTSSNPFPVELPARVEIEELSFIQTLGPFATYSSVWVDVRQWEWLDFDVEIESADAVNSLLEFTDAPDPNTTPPGSNDIVRSLAQQIGGTALGGPANVLSFGVPAQMRWCRVKATDITGGQTIKVSTYGQSATPTPAQLPIAATVTQDFRAPIMQSIEKGRDPANTFQNRRFSGFVTSQSTTTTLAANTEFMGTSWMSTTGFVGIGVLVKSDANSATNGLKILFSADSVNTHLVGGPVTYDGAPDGRIYKFGIATPGVTFKLSLTAGNSDMTNLTLRTYLLADDTEDVSIQLGDVPNERTIADVSIAQLTALKDGGGFVNQKATTSGNLKIAIAEHASDTPIKELTGGGTVLRKTIDSGSAVQADDPALSSRKTISIYVDEDNTDDVFYGYSDSVTTSSGFKLVAGSSKEWEIGDNIHLYFCTATDGQKIYVDQIA
jgi:hypothetical protein